MVNSQRTEFGAICRNLRKGRGLRLRQVAEILGVALSTYGNVESSKYRIVGESKASALATFYRLPAPDRDRLMAAWSATPLSPFSEKRQERFEKLKQSRKLAKLVPALKLSLCEVLGMHIGLMDDDKICVCDFGGEPCEVCKGLTTLELDTFSTKDHALLQLTKLQDKLEAARAAAQNGAKP